MFRKFIAALQKHPVYLSIIASIISGLIVGLVMVIMFPKPEANKARYQHIGTETIESRISSVNPNTKETIYEYVPANRNGIIDTWSGKIYYTNDIFEDIIVEEDRIHGKQRAYRIEQPDMSLLNIDYKKLENIIKQKLENKKQTKNDDLIKSYIQGGGLK